MTDIYSQNIVDILIICSELQKKIEKKQEFNEIYQEYTQITKQRIVCINTRS